MIELLAILAMIYIPFLARIFNHVPLPALFWFGLGLNALLLYGMEWIRKLLNRVYIKKRHEKTSLFVFQEVKR